MRLLIACLLCALALPGAAQIYTYTDANGNTVFTNQPPQGQATETIELPPTNTLQAQQPSVPEPAKPAATAQISYTILQLTDVPSDEALRANSGTFTVGVRIEPRLRAGHLLRLLLDGQPHGQAANATRLQLVNVARGEHSLAVEVLSGDQQIQQSAPLTFTLQRVNTSSPARRPPAPSKPTPKPAT